MKHSSWVKGFSIYPCLTGAGKDVANMIAKLLNGSKISDITPQWPKYGVSFDKEKMKQFGLTIPAEYQDKTP